MTIEDKIAVLYQIAPEVYGFNDAESFKKLVKTVNAFISTGPALVKLAGLIATLEKEQRMQGAKSAGKGSALKVAEKILKRAPKHCQSLHFANIIDGNQYICDGFICVCYSEGNHLPLEEMPKNLQPMDRLPSFFVDMTGEDVEVPNLKALKNYIKMQKSLHKSEKNYRIPFDFGIGNCQFNAQFLAELIEMLPEAKAKIGKDKLIFKDEQGNKGLLCGVRPPQGKERKKTEI